MATSHSINSSARFGVLRFWDRVDGDQLVSEAKAFFESPSLEPGYRIMWDARDVEKLELTLDDVKSITDLLAEVRPRIGPGRSAIVGHSPDVVTSSHLLRALAARDAARQVEIFREIGPALRWLGLGEAQESRNETSSTTERQTS